MTKPILLRPTLGRRLGGIAPGAMLMLSALAPIALLMLPSGVRAQNGDATAPDPIPRQEATPTPTPTPSGQYVFDGADYVEYLDSSAQQFEPNISSGSISGTASDNFDAGQYGQIWRNATRSDSVTTTYRWYWETENDAPPEDYTPVFFFDYNGNVTGSATGGATQALSGSGSASTGGNSDTNQGNSSSRVVGTPQSGSASVSMSQTLSLSSSLTMHASNGRVNGNLNQSVTGSIELQ